MVLLAGQNLSLKQLSPACAGTKLTFQNRTGTKKRNFGKAEKRNSADFRHFAADFRHFAADCRHFVLAPFLKNAISNPRPFQKNAISQPQTSPKLRIIFVDSVCILHAWYAQICSVAVHCACRHAGRMRKRTHKIKFVETTNSSLLAKALRNQCFVSIWDRNQGARPQILHAVFKACLSPRVRVPGILSKELHKLLLGLCLRHARTTSFGGPYNIYIYIYIYLCYHDT